jgi:hypothetical protein
MKDTLARAAIDLLIFLNRSKIAATGALIAPLAPHDGIGSAGFAVYQNVSVDAA